MVTSLVSRRWVVVLVAVSAGLVVVTLYRMEVLTTQQPAHGQGVKFWQRARESGSGVATTTTTKTTTTNIATNTQAPLLKTREQQIAAGNTLYNILVTEPLEYNCSHAEKITNRIEGSWTYCTDPHLALTKPCLVYSFGINNDFSFDDALGNLGCDVYSFDPSMNTPDHRRNPHVMFYQTGLGGQDTDTFEPHLDSYVKKKTTWKMRTLKTLMKELGHADRTIDLLKIDIETSEWPSVRNMLDSGVLRQVKQLVLEWHIFPAYPSRESFQRLISVLRDVRRVGFRSFYRHPLPPVRDWNNFRLQSDFGYVNERFLKNSPAL